MLTGISTPSSVAVDEKSVTFLAMVVLLVSTISSNVTLRMACRAVRDTYIQKYIYTYIYICRERYCARYCVCVWYV
jgi:hypothetical protein